MKKLFLANLLFLLTLLTIFLFLYQKKQAEESFVLLEKNMCRDCNVILITMTNLRYDHMSSNGYFRPTTPNLDKLAKESLVFDNAFAHSSWTLPEGISIYTGLYPYQHGVMNRDDGSKLSPNIPTLVDILNSNGYKTAAFTGGFDYNTNFGLTSRFLMYQECTKDQGANQIFDYGEFGCNIPKALEWLKLNANRKFFLHVQGYDAHCPFSQRGGYMYDQNYKGKIDYTGCLWTFDRSQPVIQNGKTFYPVYSAKTGTRSAVLLGEKDIYHLVAVYDEAIRFADLSIGQLLYEVKNMGLSDKTIIIFTSEHGDIFGKHGRFMRGGPLRGTFYDDVLHVPLIIKHPKIAPKRFDGLVSHVDLMPSILEFLGLISPSNIGGKNLVPLIFNNKEVNSYVFAGSAFNPDQNNPNFFKKTKVDSIRNKEWKLIQETIFDSAMHQAVPDQTVELYDIINDKGELRNLKDQRKDILDSLESKLSSWLERIKQR